MRPFPPLPLVALLLLVSACAVAQTQSDPQVSKLPEPLVQALQKAVNTNPEVQARWNAFLAANGLRDLAHSGLLPQVDLSVSVGSENRSTPSLATTQYATSAATLSVNQTLFDGFFTAHEVRRLGVAARTRYYELAEAAQMVALDAFKAYADVLLCRELVELATQNYLAHRQSTLLVEERASAGVGRRVDVEQASGRQAVAESSLLTELTQLHSARARYVRVVGEPPPALPTLPEPFRLGILPIDTQALMRDGIQNSPTLLAALQNARSVQIAAQTAAYAFMPRINAQAYLARGNNNAEAGDNQAQGAALVLNYNLFKGGADQANTQLASHNAGQARALQDKACRDVRQVLSLAYSDVHSLDEKLSYEDRHLLATEKTREAFRQQFELGQRSLMDLLDTQKEYFESARAYAQARHDQASAQARTLAAMGLLLSAVGAQRTDMAGAMDSGDDHKAALNALCEGTELTVDSVDSIKARLNVSRPERPLGSYVVLLPDRNQVVGQVTVEGSGGKQVLTEAQKGVQADGGGAAFAVSDEQLKRDFGAVMAALPQAPERFVLYFQAGANGLTSESKALLPKIVERAAAHPALDVSLVGHTDSAGSEQANDALGRARAAFVAQQLRELGLKSDWVSMESSGKKNLQVATPDNTKEPRNRRVEVILR